MSSEKCPEWRIKERESSHHGNCKFETVSYQCYWRLYRSFPLPPREGQARPFPPRVLDANSRSGSVAGGAIMSCFQVVGIVPVLLCGFLGDVDKIVVVERNATIDRQSDPLRQSECKNTA